MLLYTRLAPPKVPKKRSRAGCNFCKEKKKKCDETRPLCSRCAENGQDCVYEAIKPRQRRKRDNLSIDTTDTHTPQSMAGFDIEESQQTPLSGGLSIQQWDQQQRWRAADDDSAAAAAAAGIGAGGDGRRLEPNAAPSHIQMPGSVMDDDMTESIFAPWTPSESVIFSPLTPSPFDFGVMDGRPAAPSNNTNDGNDDDDDQDIEEIIRRDSIASHTTTNSSNSLTLLPHTRHASSTATTTNSNNNNNNPQTPCSPSPHLEFCHPAFAEFSSSRTRRSLVDHFCNVLSHLIVFREENGNPFQQLVLPLSRRSPAVMDAIYALASAHLEFRGVGVGNEKSEYFHGRAIQGLARLIEKRGKGDRNELLAAIMLLVYYEVLVQRGRSNIVDGHLKGAMTIMDNQEASTDPTGVFLERAFRFYDVIAALSFGTAPLSIGSGRGSLSPLPPLDSTGATSPSGSVDTLLGLATSLWPIIHRLSNLVGVKEELNQAVAQNLVSKVAVLRSELDTTASAILAALEQWQPILPPEMCNSSANDDNEMHNNTEGSSSIARARIQSILNNALAYRHSAFVYLYRTIKDFPRSHPMVQHHAHLSLTHCVGTVNHEGPMSALLWPLFVAACEATSMVDRELARQTFVAIDRRQGMINIERAWCIVQEVWRRADEAELETMFHRQQDDVVGLNEKDKTGGDIGLERRRSVLQEDCAQMRHGKGVGGDLWRRVSKDMGVTIVFG